MGVHLPVWLTDMYKVCVRVCACVYPGHICHVSLLPQLANAPSLLRLYLTYDLLQPAALLAIEYIDAVMGHGKEFFGLKVQ